jgi:hypothetical protein
MGYHLSNVSPTNSRRVAAPSNTHVAIGQRAMINALVMLAAAGFGFGGSPWIGFAICAPAAIMLSFPQHLDVLARNYGQPKTDIALMILMYFGLVTVGAFASAWVGYILALEVDSTRTVNSPVVPFDCGRDRGNRRRNIRGRACFLRNIGAGKEFLTCRDEANSPGFEGPRDETRSTSL